MLVGFAMTALLVGGANTTAMVLEEQIEAAMRRGYVAAFRILGDPDDARDACQEAAARVLAARDRYDPEQPLYPWFYRVLKNHCLDRLRRRGRIEARQVDQEVADASKTAESRVLDDERSRAVRSAIAGLPEDQREIIELRHFQDLSYEEMAKVLNCPTGTVMSRLYRARKSLRAALAAGDGGDR